MKFLHTPRIKKTPLAGEQQENNTLYEAISDLAAAWHNFTKRLEQSLHWEDVHEISIVMINNIVLLVIEYL